MQHTCTLSTLVISLGYSLDICRYIDKDLKDDYCAKNNTDFLFGMFIAVLSI